MQHDKPQFMSRSSLYLLQENTVKPNKHPINTDEQFALFLGKESPYIFSKFNPVNTDILYGPLSVCINDVWLYGEKNAPSVVW